MNNDFDDGAELVTAPTKRKPGRPRVTTKGAKETLVKIDPDVANAQRVIVEATDLIPKKPIPYNLAELKRSLDKIFASRGSYKIDEKSATWQMDNGRGGIDSGTLIQPARVILRCAENILRTSSFIYTPNWAEDSFIDY